MDFINIMGWIIIIIICLIFTPLMTIGTILICANSLGIFGDIIGTICIIGGLVRMFVNIFSD